MVKNITTKQLKAYQRQVTRNFWKEGCDYEDIDQMNFSLSEAIGYWEPGISYLFKDYLTGHLRYWFITKSYFERKRAE